MGQGSPLPSCHPSSLGASLCLCILVLQGGKSQREPANINPASREANELLSGLTAHKKGAAKGPQPQGEGLAAEGPCTGATVPCAPMLEAARCQILHTQSFHTKKKKKLFQSPLGLGGGFIARGLHCTVFSGSSCSSPCVKTEPHSRCSHICPGSGSLGASTATFPSCS